MLLLLLVVVVGGGGRIRIVLPYGQVALLAPSLFEVCRDLGLVGRGLNVQCGKYISLKILMCRLNTLVSIL